MQIYNPYLDKQVSHLEEKTDFIRSFLNRKKINVVFDFGCGNGEVIESIAKDFPNIMFVGYDNDTDLIAKNNSKSLLENVIYVDEIIHDLFDMNTLVILSSVLHEIFSKDNSVIRQFFNDFYETLGNAGAFCIRDMFFIGHEYNIKVHEQIVLSLFPESYDKEMNEDYNATLWDMFNSSLRSYKFVLKFDVAYKNSYLSNKIDIINNFKTTHRKQVWERAGGKAR